MLDERLHRRIVAVKLTQLDRKAFAQVARADPRRIEFLQHREYSADVIRPGTGAFGSLAKISWQVAGLVREIDQVLTDHALRGLAEGHGQLLGQMIGERQFGCDKSLQ